ncbi:hypothetical protein [Nocardia sp. alder85J]|uniref:hypothetical protein n=1 Tax=Nocardia sp. alder85J TaxID=2862949 RepID=UPI0022537938|nr:hypothetical protein [Nocardia sp. alder85J]MCX4099317.1 hypothetical protein [Nocardia sp. alder85J]
MSAALLPPYRQGAAHEPSRPAGVRPPDLPALFLRPADPSAAPSPAAPHPVSTSGPQLAPTAQYPSGDGSKAAERALPHAAAGQPSNAVRHPITPEPTSAGPEPSVPADTALLAIGRPNPPESGPPGEPERKRRWPEVVELALTHRPGNGVIITAAVVVAGLLMLSCLLLARPGSHPTAASAATVQVNRGFTLGSVKANDGKTLQVQDALGAVSTIHTTADTEVLVLLATRVTDIPKGAWIMVHGNRETDGSITANLIMGIETGPGGK